MIPNRGKIRIKSNGFHYKGLSLQLSKLNIMFDFFLFHVFFFSNVIYKATGSDMLPCKPHVGLESCVIGAIVIVPE